MEKDADNQKITAFCHGHEDVNNHDRFRDGPAASGIVAIFPDLISG